MPTHKKPESERFKGPAKYAEYLVARALITVLQRLPIRVAYRLGRGVGWLAWKCLARRRATVRKNLEIVNAWMDARSAESGDFLRAEGGNLNPERVTAAECKKTQVSGFKSHPSLELDAQVRAVFQRSGANLLSGFTFARMSPETAEKHIVFEGLDLLKSSLEEGKGVIILLAHMGPWEALNHLPRVAKKVGIEAPFGALYRPLNNNYLDEWFKGVREIQGTRLFSHRDGFHKPAEFIKSGGMLGILSDQKLKRGELVPFFGVPAKTSPIPGLMQRRSHSPVLRASISTIDQARWQIQVDTVQYPKDPTMRQRETEARLTNKGLESMLSQSILDGFWFHKRYSNSQYSDASR